MGRWWLALRRLRNTIHHLWLQKEPWERGDSQWKGSYARTHFQCQSPGVPGMSFLATGSLKRWRIFRRRCKTFEGFSSTGSVLGISAQSNFWWVPLYQDHCWLVGPPIQQWCWSCLSSKEAWGIHGSGSARQRVCLSDPGSWLQKFSPCVWMWH